MLARTLPCLNVIRLLPKSLTDHLSGTGIMKTGLNLDVVPSVMNLHRHTVLTVRSLQRHYGVVIPEMNMAPVLSRMVDAMLLPPTFYIATKSLLSFLGIDACLINESIASQYARNASPSDVGKFTSSTRGSLNTNTTLNSKIPRCVIFMAVLIVVIRLRWGLDGYARPDRGQGIKENPVFSASPQLYAWLDALEATQGESDVHIHPPFRPWDTSTDLLGMSDSDIDRYLDFIDTNYRPYNIPAILRSQERTSIEDFLAFAPLESPPDPQDPYSELDRVESEQRRYATDIRKALYDAPEPIYPSDGIYLAPGEAVTIGRFDLFGDLHRDFERVLKAAQRILSLDMNTEAKPLEKYSSIVDDHDILLQAVRCIEDLLQRQLYSNYTRRNPRGQDEIDNVDHDDVETNDVGDMYAEENEAGSSSDSESIINDDDWPTLPTP